MAQHPHLFVPSNAKPTRFTSPSSGPREGMSVPARNRAEHAERLRTQLEGLGPVATARAEEQQAFGLEDGLGLYIVFESDPNFALKFESLDLIKSGIELCTVKTLPDNSTQATVFVPDGKLETFLKKIEAYRDEDTKPSKKNAKTRPKNQDLVESISGIKLAALEALWSEDSLPFPDSDIEVTWEIWLRRSNNVDYLARLRDHAEEFKLVVGEEIITFVDRSIVLVTGTAANLAQSAEILGMIAEVRAPKRTAAFFTEMKAIDQQALVDQLAGRLQAPPAGSPFVTLLDTGVNRGHALISGVVDQPDLHTYKPGWGTDDRYGHGTQMAGLASFGDLTEVLQGAGQVACTHRIESVKVLNERDPHDPDLYGAVTQESVYRVEVIPDRKRVFCMSVTSTDGRDRGRPTSWSAAVDSLAAGEAEGAKRLVILSAGNTMSAERRNYPASNLTDSIHDPAQAWNALTVGGCTDKVSINKGNWPDWNPLATAGDLAPSSCTSVTWGRGPLKPDIVMEAGNLASNAAVADPADLEDLQLLSTAHDFATRPPLTTFGDTSASAALAARFAAMVWAKYPNLTPETVRALMVHSAEWTPAMLARFTNVDGTIDYRTLLRCFGYGVPNLQRLLSSLDNSLTLVAESELHPFLKEDGDIKTREMKLHPLPWPSEALTALQNTDVTMRVTLSYFVEPSPGSRGRLPRYSYQSHGLRFAVRNSLETVADFERRINKFAREEDYKAPGLNDPGWRFGRFSGLTSLGSIHSDQWTGKAVDLASRGYLAIYPTMGWWNKRPYLEAWRNPARYSLIVSIAAPEVETDLYTPIANKIGVPIVIEV